MCHQNDRDRKQALSAHAQNKRFFSLAHGLQAVDLLEIGDHKGGCQTGNAQKLRSVSNGRLITDEYPNDLRGKYLKQHDKYAGCRTYQSYSK